MAVEIARVAAIKELLGRGCGKVGQLVPGYDDVLGDRHPDHGGTITIEFIRPPEQPSPIEGKPPPGINGSRH